MLWLGLFFPFMTDCWYSSRKPKCKSHLWLHRCPPSRPSPQVQTCSLWQQPWVGGWWELGVLSWRGAAHLAWSQPLCFVNGHLSLPADMWVMGAGGRVWGARSYQPSKWMVFNDLSSRGWTVLGFLQLFFPPPSQDIFQCCACWFHVTNPLSWLLILLAVFLTTLYWLLGKGGEKPPLGSEAQLLPLYFYLFLLLLFFRLSFMSQLPSVWNEMARPIQPRTHLNILNLPEVC